MLLLAWLSLSPSLSLLLLWASRRGYNSSYNYRRNSSYNSSLNSSHAGSDANTNPDTNSVGQTPAAAHETILFINAPFAKFIH